MHKTYFIVITHKLSMLIRFFFLFFCIRVENHFVAFMPHFSIFCGSVSLTRTFNFPVFILFSLSLSLARSVSSFVSCTVIRQFIFSHSPSYDSLKFTIRQFRVHTNLRTWTVNYAAPIEILLPKSCIQQLVK